MAAKRTRQRTIVTLAITFELPSGMSMEKGRKQVLDDLFRVMSNDPSWGSAHLNLKVKVLERHVRYTERGTVTPDGA